MDPSIETVDLTSEICKLFDPTEDIATITEEIRKNAPIPLEDLSIEEDMLNGYCKRFGK